MPLAEHPYPAQNSLYYFDVSGLQHRPSQSPAGWTAAGFRRHSEATSLAAKAGARNSQRQDDELGPARWPTPLLNGLQIISAGGGLTFYVRFPACF